MKLFKQIVIKIENLLLYLYNFLQTQRIKKENRQKKIKVKKGNKIVSSFNISWNKVSEWLSDNLICPETLNSKIIEFNENHITFKSLDNGKIFTYPIYNNVIDFTGKNFRTKIFNKIQSEELKFWVSGGIQRRIIKDGWQNYSKYNYHFNPNFFQILKKDGYEIPDPFNAFETILDLGCGPFGIAKNFNASKFKIGVDSLALEYSKLMHVDFTFLKIACYGEKLPFKSGCFDLIITTNALDHFISWRDTIKEMVRCTRINGYIFIDMDCKNELELDKLHQIDIEPEEVLREIEKQLIQVKYIQIGPRKVCEKRLILIGKRIN